MLAEDRLNETSPARGDGGPPEPPRRPYWPAALFVIGLLVALLGAAVVLNDRFRPRPTIEPTATAAITTRPAAAAAPSTPPTAQPTTVPTSTVAPTAVPTPTTAPTSAPSPTAAASRPTSAAVTPGATPAGTAAASVLTPLQKEIVDGYLRYWEVRAHAYYYLDTSRLKEVMAGAELAREEENIRRLRAEGRAANWNVELNYRITKATPDEATVEDEYFNQSVYIDAVTKQEVPTKEPPGVVKVSFQLKPIDGAWKVVDGVRRG